MAAGTKEAPAPTEKPVEELLKPEDVFRPDVTEQIAKEQAGIVTPEPPAVSEPGPAGDGAPPAPATPVASEEKPAPKLEQREDGKWQIGNFIGDTLEEVAQKAGEAHFNSAQQMHRQANQLDELKKSLSLDPEPDDDEISDAEWEAFQAHQRNQGQQPQGQPSQYEVAQLYRFAERVLDNAHSATPKQWEQAAINALTLGDDQLYSNIVGEWSQVDQSTSTRFLHDVSQAQQAMQQQVAYEQQAAVQERQAHAVNESQRALQAAWGAFQNETPDAAALDAGIRTFLQARPFLMQGAQAAALQSRSAEPVLEVYRLAAQAARQTAGVQQPVAGAQVPANYNPATGTFQQAGAQVPDPQQQQNQQIVDMKRQAEVGLGGASDITVNSGGNAPEGQIKQELDAFIRLMNGPAGLEPYR